MIQTKSSKVLSRIVIILLIMAFSVGLIACSADVITGSVGKVNASVIDNPPTLPTDMQEELKKYPADTYRKIYTPYSGGPNYRTVSYLDTNTLNEIWKKTIRHGLAGDGRGWFIRDADNWEADHRLGNYYYFDENFDIVHAAGASKNGYANGVKMKRFLGAIIVDYSSNANEGKGNFYRPYPDGGWSESGGMAHLWGYFGLLVGAAGGAFSGKSATTENRGVGLSSIIGNQYGASGCIGEAFADMMGTWSIGGLYEHVLNYRGKNSEGREGYANYGKYYFIDFMQGDPHQWGEGALSVVVMNIGYSDEYYNEFGFDQYYSTDYNYRENRHNNAKTNFLGKDPEIYTRKLDVRKNHSYYWGYPDEYTGYKCNFKWVCNNYYRWHTNENIFSSL